MWDNDDAVPPLQKPELQKYIGQSNKIANIEHSPLEHMHIVILAIRDIKKDEELYVFYGLVY